MTLPQIQSIHPPAGPASGGEVVRLLGHGFARNVAVRFGSTPATKVLVHIESGHGVIDAWTPTHAAGPADIVVDNLDATARPVAGERTVVPGGYRFERPLLVGDSLLTLVVRTLLRSLKDQVLEDVHLSVAVDYDDGPEDGLRVTTLARLPSLVLAGPQARPNRLYTSQVASHQVLAGLIADDVLLRRPAPVVDLVFQLTGASNSAIELLNLAAAVARFLDRNRWLVVPRPPTEPVGDDPCFELDTEDGVRTRMAGADGVHVFTIGLVVRGVPLVEGPVLDRTRRLDTAFVHTGATRAEETL